MSRILVNWSNPYITSNTNNKGLDCIGSAYTVKTETNEIEFTQTEVEAKLGKINSLIQLFKTKPYTTLSAEPGESITGTMVRQLKRELVDALFDSSTAPASPYTYYSYSDKQVSPRTVERTRTYILQTLNGFKLVLEAILRLDSGIARLNPDGIELPPGGLAGGTKVYTFQVNVEKLVLPVTQLVQNSVQSLLTTKLTEFYDESRELKTLVNFGNDRQVPLLAWRQSPSDSTKLQLKLTTPLPSDISEGFSAHISRELAYTVIDGMELTYAADIDRTPSLRPRNMNVDMVPKSAQTNNVTLQSLGLNTGSSGIVQNSTITYSDRVFREWYTSDFNSSELNIDFSDYRNFVFYGSAEARLVAFANKLNNVSTLLRKTTSGGTASLGASAASLELESIIRGFDPYEQYLYYTTNSAAYSSSFYGEYEYNSTGSWPKRSDGTIYFPSESVAQDWYNTQIQIARRYDGFNENYLVYHLPEYLQFDENSSEFLTFVAMIGHVFDNLKVYIDQFPHIYSTTPDPLQDLTMDQLYEVATSFGLKLPNAYSLEQLHTFISNIDSDANVRQMVSETWKRFLHNMIWLYKSKGTRTGLNSILSIYGIAPQLLPIKETSSPRENNYISTYEYSNGLRFTSQSNAYLQISFASASFTPQTFEMRFTPEWGSSTLVTSPSQWAIRIATHPTTSMVDYGRIEFVSGSATIATSSYFRLFADDATNLVLRSQSSGITYDILQADGDMLLLHLSGSIPLQSMWNNSTNLYVGGSGSLSTIPYFAGVVDEIKVWGEPLTDTILETHAYDPSSYVGNTYTSSYSSLYTYLTFSIPTASNSGSSGLIPNETPYQSASLVSHVNTVGFVGTGSYTRLERYVKQPALVVGAESYTTTKVHVVSSPVFKPESIDGTGTKILSPRKSIVNVSEKLYTDGLNSVILAVSPTDYINQNIIRSMGPINVNELIGDPATLTGSFYPALAARQKQYNIYYRQTINPNKYIQFFRNLTNAPSEAAEDYVPANTNLIGGVVIEPTVLERNRQSVHREISVAGGGTRDLERRINTGSISEYDLGVMQLDTEMTLSTGSTVAGEIREFDLITTVIGISSSLYPKNSALQSQLPPARRTTQTLYEYVEEYFSSSLFDEGSGIPTLYSDIDVRQENVDSVIPYARYIYEDEDGVDPLYEIRPSSDISEIGTSTYFYKENNVYWFRDITNPRRKREYIPKLDSNTNNALAVLYADITLLDTGSDGQYPGRYSSEISAGTLSANTTAVGTIRVADIFALYAIDGQQGLRLRLYNSQEALANDASRPFGVLPTGSHGVQFDALLAGVDEIHPYVMVKADVSPNAGLLYYKIDNLETSNRLGNITLYYFAFDPINTAPEGYLPRHYRFYRENTTALKRRNYVGCLQTDSTTPDGLPPVQTKLTRTSTVVVPPATPQTGNPKNPSIILGGGGTLDVF